VPRNGGPVVVEKGSVDIDLFDLFAPAGMDAQGSDADRLRGDLLGHEASEAPAHQCGPGIG
jgi:hypothetical protein